MGKEQITKLNDEVKSLKAEKRVSKNKKKKRKAQKQGGSMLSNSAEAVKLELFSNTLKRPIKEIETEIHHQVKKQRIKIEKNLDEESPLDERENTKKKSKKAIDFDSEEDDITPSNGDDKQN